MHLNGILDKWSHQTVYVQHHTTSWDSYGNPILSTSSAHTALVQKTMRLVRTRDGTEKVANTEIFFHSTDAIGYDDIITLPSGETPLILSIEGPVDFDGNTEYYRVYT